MDRLLAGDGIAALVRERGRPLVLEAVRGALDEARAAVAAAAPSSGRSSKRRSRPGFAR